MIFTARQQKSYIDRAFSCLCFGVVSFKFERSDATVALAVRFPGWIYCASDFFDEEVVGHTYLQYHPVVFSCLFAYKFLNLVFVVVSNTLILGVAGFWVYFAPNVFILLLALREAHSLML